MSIYFSRKKEAKKKGNPLIQSIDFYRQILKIEHFYWSYCTKPKEIEDLWFVRIVHIKWLKPKWNFIIQVIYEDDQKDR
jgi:hypothetical protein